ncbi:hypothetical protein GCM10022243_05070 [Saccharothrix violaceirubra]|uniref:Putative repeat protein (TIGR01451 family) n=1 Tax=Saccharothrix violaceirubra TaxID=413306 RepID=A0A7W7SXS2_9PSEU|nr:SdrD B-like domain-containing protein [Saccharothrix violaceirubra]MBB4962917.1 putative repeat protein (TIGR01451 family) [Saccharothrix violaceirubra]
MARSRFSRRIAAALVSAGVVACSVVVSAPTANAAVVRPFTLNFNEEVYGDFIEVGNTVTTCPSGADPIDPLTAEPHENCDTAQGGTLPNANAGNDAYYMRWYDVDGQGNTVNSTRASITIPPGARVDYARLNWAGDTGTIRLADGTVSPTPGCSTRQFLGGAGTSNLPSGTPESTSVRVTIGGGTQTSYAPQVISRDALANVPNSQPQFYSAYANVTSQFAAAPTGSAQTITVGNIWTPEGFGCFGGWSLVLVYAYDQPDATYAPTKREIFLYDGHVRQSSADPATTTTVSGFRVAANGVRAGLTAFEGDANITGDQFSINGTAVTEPLPGGSDTNYFVSNSNGDTTPSTVNNLSVDAKEFPTTLLPVGSTSATLTFSTSGDTYMATNLVLSVPIPSVSLKKVVTSATTVRPGDTVNYEITVVAPGSSNAVGVSVADPLASGCNRAIGNLTAGTPYVYTCSGPAPDDDFTNVATASGLSDFGDPVTGSGQAAVTVINPELTITKVPDQSTYTTGQTITFTITVTNTGNSALTNVSVADPGVPSCASLPQPLAEGGSFTYTCTATAPLASDTNTATVTGTDALNGPVTASATASAPTPSVVTGRVFSDRNNNGVFESGQGDTGILGVPVRLLGSTTAGVPVDTTVNTIANGTYTFTNVVAGTYSIIESTQPVDFDDGIDTPGTSSSPSSNDRFTLVKAGGVDSTGNNFAERPTSSLSGSVYEDTNGNGSRDGGEPGLYGVAVSLFGTDSAGNSVSFATSTVSDGLYSFQGLRPGSYLLAEETQPASYADGAEEAGTAGGVPNGGDAIININLDPRTDGTGYTFGEYVGATLTGRVFDDGGNGIPNVQINIAGPGAFTTTTGPDGTYSFSNLPPGTYTVTEVQPVGYGDGAETAGTAGGIPGPIATDQITNIVLPSRATASGYTFAEDRGSLAGTVYEDIDNDGVKDIGENGLSGVFVTLTGTDYLGRGVNINTLTAANGTYSFANLVGGSYTLTEVQPGAFADGKETIGNSGGVLSPPNSITTIPLAGGFDATGYLFGEFVAATLSGRVVDDAGTGIAGVVISATNGDGTVTATTIADGTYSFPSLPPGTYTITEAQPTGYGDSTDTVGSAGGTYSAPDSFVGVVLPSATTATGYEFTEDRASLAGTVYEDLNGNGTKQPLEPGIAGVTVALTGLDALSAPVSLTTTTGSDGTFLFEGLLGGTYTLTETTPATYADGIDVPGSAGGTANPPDSIVTIPLGGGVEGDGYLFAEYKGVGLSGSVVNDQGNGIAGVTLTLTGPGGPYTQVTANDGTYAFTNLPPGTYTLVETQPLGYADGTETVGTAGGTATDNQIAGIVIPSGGSATGYQFAEDRGSLSGTVYEDADGSGTKQPLEPGIAGVTVTLTGLDAASNSVSLTTTTGSDGTYTFTGLLGGTYTVTETTPATYTDGIDVVGSAGGTLEPPDSIVSIGLDPGEDATGYLFGDYKGASLAGSVLDDGGNGISGVTVTLTGPGGPFTATTDSSGTFSFTGLAPGTYALSEAQPTGYGDGAETAGTAGGTTSDNLISAIVLTSGTAATGYSFAEDRGSLAGSVFEDQNGNGSRQIGEPGIENVTVTLTGTAVGGASVSLTTTTAVDGGYVFENLVGGTYTVAEPTQPTGYLDGVDTAGTSGGTATPPDSIVNLTLAGGADATGYLFSEYVGTSISGYVLDDAEDGVAGVTITLTGPGGPFTVQTGSDGLWAFLGLAPGTYTVTETQPLGYLDGPDTAGTAGGTPGSDAFTGIVLVSGQVATGYTFTEDRGSIAGIVFDDLDGDGVLDLGEVGIPGVTLTLTGTDDASGAVTLTAVTDSGGNYTFDVIGGTYAITETQPTAFVDGTETAGTAGGEIEPPDSIVAIDLDPGEDATGYLFADLKGASVSGYVLDQNGDGIAGVTITLVGPTAGASVPPPSQTTVTNSEGFFQFLGLKPGSYSLIESQPPGYQDGGDQAGDGGGSAGNDTITDIELSPGQEAQDYEFAEVSGSIAGTVFVDKDDDGVLDPGEVGIEGVQLALLPDGNPPVTLTTTDQDGNFVFTNLAAGEYTIAENQPTGYGQGQVVVGTGGGTVEGDVIEGIVVPTGQAVTEYLFAELAGTISGVVWEDDNGDGELAGEPGRLAGVTIVLQDDEGTEIATTVTDVNGGYSFPNLIAGDYTVVEEQPDGYGSTTPNSVDVTITDDTGATVDFGDQQGSIGDFVWDDTDRDGVQDAGEPGIPDITVELLSQTDEVLKTAITDENGHYRFVGIEAGLYGIHVVAPAGWTFTTPGVGDDATNSDVGRETGLAEPIQITLTGDDITQNANVDAGLVPVAVDLAVELTVDPETSWVGGWVTFAGRVGNAGTVTIAGSRTVITVPVQLGIVEITGDGWTCGVAGQVVTCTNDAVLEPGHVTPFVLVKTAVMSTFTDVAATAAVTLINGEADENPLNDTATVTVSATEEQPPPPPVQPGPPLAWTGVSGVLPLLFLGLGILVVGAVTVRMTTRKR